MLSGLQYPRGLHVVNQSNGGSNGDEEDDENDGDVYFCEIHRDTSKQHAEHGMHGMHGEEEDEEERRMQHEKEEEWILKWHVQCLPGKNFFLFFFIFFYHLILGKFCSRYHTMYLLTS